MNSINNVAHNMVAEMSHNLNSMLANTLKFDDKPRRLAGAIDVTRFNDDVQFDNISIASSRRSKKNRSEKYRSSEGLKLDIGEVNEAKSRTKPPKKLLASSSTVEHQKAKVIRERDLSKKGSKLRKSASSQSLSNKKVSFNKKKPSLIKQPNKSVMKRNTPQVVPKEVKSIKNPFFISRVQYFDNVAGSDLRQLEEEEEQEVQNIHLEEESMAEGRKFSEPTTNSNYYEHDSENHNLGLLDYSSPYSHNYLKPTTAYHLKCVQHNYWRQYRDGRLPFVVGTAVSTSNNVRLLRQQTASKIKTFLLYNVSCDQLSDFKVHKLRSLIREVEKVDRKLKSSSTQSNSNNQENDEYQTATTDNKLECKENQ